MTKWSPEPWDHDGTKNIIDANGDLIASCYGSMLHDDEQAEAASDRIISCVNALAGIEEPEKWVKSVSFMADMEDDVRELVEAAKKLSRQYDIPVDGPRLDAWENWNALDAAIRKFDPTWRS